MCLDTKLRARFRVVIKKISFFFWIGQITFELKATTWARKLALRIVRCRTLFCKLK